MDNVVIQLTIFITTYGIKIIGAILILILGRMAAGIGRRIVVKALEKSETDPAVISFVGSLTYFLILIFAVLAALAKFGIQTASFVAVLGAAGFAIGFALQGSLGNFAAGVLILVLRPFKVGDWVRYNLSEFGIGLVVRIGENSSVVVKSESHGICTESPDSLKLWEPTIGEWCCFYMTDVNYYEVSNIADNCFLPEGSHLDSGGSGRHKLCSPGY